MELQSLGSHENRCVRVRLVWAFEGGNAHQAGECSPHPCSHTAMRPALRVYGPHPVRFRLPLLCPSLLVLLGEGTSAPRAVYRVCNLRSTHHHRHRHLHRHETDAVRLEARSHLPKLRTLTGPALTARLDQRRAKSELVTAAAAPFLVSRSRAAGLHYRAAFRSHFRTKLARQSTSYGRFSV